jgi:nitrogen fixation NifU-like protein
MTDLSDLYQEVILDHSRRPRNFGLLAKGNRRADGHNPFCGDRLTITVQLADGTIEGVGFEGQGCAISMASASLMTEAIKGKSTAEATELFGHFQALVTGAEYVGAVRDLCKVDLGKLVALSGVREFPIRVKCATLPWHTLAAALQDSHVLVKTE